MWPTQPEGGQGQAEGEAGVESLLPSAVEDPARPRSGELALSSTDNRHVKSQSANSVPYQPKVGRRVGESKKDGNNQLASNRLGAGRAQGLKGLSAKKDTQGVTGEPESNSLVQLPPWPLSV